MECKMQNTSRGEKKIYEQRNITNADKLKKQTKEARYK